MVRHCGHCFLQTYEYILSSLRCGEAAFGPHRGCASADGCFGLSDRMRTEIYHKRWLKVSWWVFYRGFRVQQARRSHIHNGKKWEHGLRSWRIERGNGWIRKPNGSGILCHEAGDRSKRLYWLSGCAERSGFIRRGYGAFSRWKDQESYRTCTEWWLLWPERQYQGEYAWQLKWDR